MILLHPVTMGDYWCSGDLSDTFRCVREYPCHRYTPRETCICTWDRRHCVEPIM
jgi:hypothetical protein